MKTGCETFVGIYSLDGELYIPPMAGLELLFTIVGLVAMAAYLYLLWRRHALFWKTIVLSLSLVIFQSSLWHVLFGEQFAAEQCEGVDPEVIFGFWHCSAWSYDFILDTYEITVSLSISVLAGLMFLYTPPKHVVQFTMLCLLIVLSLLLLFLPYEALKDYAMPCNVISALLSLTVVIDELYDHFAGEKIAYEPLV